MNATEPQIDTHGRGFRLVWIVPIVAAVIGLTLLVNHFRTLGPTVTIAFASGEGLEVGKTLVKARAVTIGRISNIVLSKDRKYVEVTAQLDRSAKDLAVSGSRFWVVRPRIGVGWATGLDTLLSGAYIGVDAGNGAKQTHFIGLEVPPPLTHPTEGRRLVLTTHDLGAISIGAPVYFRHYQVGQIIDEQLSPSGSAQITLFIDAPNDRFVTAATRFWNASGVDVDLNADGLKVRTESAIAIIAGGVAFDDMPEAGKQSSGEPSDLHLYKDEQIAMAPPEGEPHVIKMRFLKPLRGLTTGAPIEFFGVDIGHVTAVDLGYDADNQTFPVYVTGKLYPTRMGLAYTNMLRDGSHGTDDDLAALVARLSKRGFRAQPRSGNLLTGRLYLALDFIPDTPPQTVDSAARPVQIPTVDSSTSDIEAGVAKIVHKIDALPLQQIAKHADQDLVDLHATFDHVNGAVLPAATDTLNSAHDALHRVDDVLSDDSSFQTNIKQTLEDVQRTLRSVKDLADYLDRHPEALIRGRTASPLPPRPSPASKDAPP